MRVWIDGDLCTGVALCESSCPDVFAMTTDGIAQVKDAMGNILPDRAMAAFEDSNLEAVLEAAEGCPEECIYIES